VSPTQVAEALQAFATRDSRFVIQSVVAEAARPRTIVSDSVVPH
jgi:hypothetical protein